MRSFDVFFDLRPYKQLSKQWWGWRFETPSCPLWHHCNETRTSLSYTLNIMSAEVLVTQGARTSAARYWPNSQIPQYTCSISHNAPFRTEMCTFLFWMVHCGIWNRCIVGFVRLVSCPEICQSQKGFCYIWQHVMQTYVCGQKYLVWVLIYRRKCHEGKRENFIAYACDFDSLNWLLTDWVLWCHILT